MGEWFNVVCIALPSMGISFLALAFAVVSFWWMNWRKGKLHTGAPRSYALYAQPEDRIVLRLPLVFFNDGAAPIIIRNLRVILANEREPRPLVFVATLDAIQSNGPDEHRELATQLPIRGREAVRYICEFQRKPGGLYFTAGSLPLELQALLDEGTTWQSLLRCPLNIEHQNLAKIHTHLTACDNLVDV